MVNPTAFVPAQGDAVWITLNPRAGHEQAGRRPAVILSPRAYNGKVGLVLLCPITSQMKGYPFEVVLPEGLKISGAVLSDQVKCLNWRARQASLICRLPGSVVGEVLGKLGSLLRAEQTL